MRRPIVCRSPTDSLWLLLKESYNPGHAGSWWSTSTWLNLETAEVREMMWSHAQMLNRGWRVVEGDIEWEAL